MTEQEKEKYYQAFLNKDKSFEGTFFAGIKTTGIFCHSTCSAKKALYKNCEFFTEAKEALLAGYRPCKICKPLSNPNMVSEKIEVLIKAVEETPEKVWKEQDFRHLGITESAARRQFQKRFNMTFVEYARSRRLGESLKAIRDGGKVIDAQLDAGFESDSGYREALKNTFGVTLSSTKEIKEMYSIWIDTKIGSMIGISDENSLYLLEFVDRWGLENEIKKMKKRLNAIIIPKTSIPLEMIKEEMTAYFENPQMEFKTPMAYLGSDFSKGVWDSLVKLKAGDVITYTDLAERAGNASAVRAAGRANGLNQLCIIVPCHRVVSKSGDLTGYGGGIERKRWLLEHEGADLSGFKRIKE